MPDDPGPPEEVLHNRQKGLVVHLRKVPMHHHDEIEPLWHPAHVEPEVLSQPSPHPIPGHRTADAAADRQAETNLRPRALANKQAEAFPGNLFAASNDFLELGRPPNTIRPRKAVPHLWLRRPHRPWSARYTARRFLPLARRRFNTRRPAFVRIRRRNPWVRFRFARLG